MAHCKNCGVELAVGAKFCQSCGCPTGVEQSNHSQRGQEYAGKLYKCPACGEVLKSFEFNCPSCGHELRGTQASSAVKEFALKLEAIEAKREYEKPRGIFAANEELLRVSKTDQQKISLIKNFAVPNSKEDMLEFMILATSNMNMSVYDSSNTTVSKGEKELTAAWHSKAKQVYEKAKRSYSSDDVFKEIQELYDECQIEMKKSQKKGTMKLVLAFGWIPIVFILAFVMLFVTEPKSEAKENERLENIVLEVQQALADNEYSHALRLADSIEYQRTDDEAERKWNIQKQYWVEKVLETASQNGVELEHVPSPPEEDNTPEPTAEESSGGFVEGVMSGLQPGLDAAKDNIDEFKEIMSNSGTEKQEEYTKTSETQTVDTTSYSENTIEKGVKYSYGSDEFNLYVATAISDTIIKIEHWDKNLSTEKAFSYEYDVGTYKITDAENGFVWVDDEHTAFTITMQDKKNSDLKKAQLITFTINITDKDEHKGASYNKKIACYSFTNDDWHQYRAIMLTNTLMKIEVWYRGFALGSFGYGYDLCLVDTTSNENDFEWADEEKDAFVITLVDPENSSLKNPTLVTLMLESEKYDYENVQAFLDQK